MDECLRVCVWGGLVHGWVGVCIVLNSCALNAVCCSTARLPECRCNCEIEREGGRVNREGGRTRGGRGSDLENRIDYLNQPQLSALARNFD